MLLGRGELLERGADLAGQPAQPDRLVVVDGQQPAQRQGRERQRQVLHHVHRAGSVRGQPADELAGQLVQLVPVPRGLGRGEVPRRGLPALPVRRSGPEHHRAVHVAGEGVVAPARLEQVQLIVGRRAERRVTQQPGAAGERADQVSGRDPGEADGQERGQVAELGVQRVRVVQRPRPDQPQEDPQGLRLLGPAVGGEHTHLVTTAGSGRARVAQKSSSAAAVGPGCSMLALCEARSITTRSGPQAPGQVGVHVRGPQPAVALAVHDQGGQARRDELGGAVRLLGQRLGHAGDPARVHRGELGPPELAHDGVVVGQQLADQGPQHHRAAVGVQLGQPAEHGPVLALAHAGPAGQQGQAAGQAGLGEHGGPGHEPAQAVPDHVRRASAGDRVDQVPQVAGQPGHGVLLVRLARSS